MNMFCIKNYLIACAVAVVAASGVVFTSDASAGRGSCRRGLMAVDVDVNAKDICGMTPLNNAARAGNLEDVKNLLARGAAVNVVSREGITPLHYAVESRHLAVVTELLLAGAHVNRLDAEGTTPLQAAEVRCYDEIVALLNTPIHQVQAWNRRAPWVEAVVSERPGKRQRLVCGDTQIAE